MTILPPYLQPGDTVGIVCPAGWLDKEKALSCLQVLQDWGYKVKQGRTLNSVSDNYFSGTDEERLTDLQEMLDDEEVKAVLCGRGGYGTGRIIDRLSFKQFKQHPKWVIGFSDITVLHSHIYSNYKTASLHAPMAAAFNEDGDKNEFIQSLKHALEGKKLKYECGVHDLNRRGEAVGELVGGNLSLLAHLTGTESDIKTKGKILFLEEVGEYLYATDRMLYQLKRSGKLDRLAGLIVGGFTDTKDTPRPFGQTVYEIVRDVVKEYDYPVCYGFPVSHERENYALKIGVGHKLKVGKNKVVLEE
jgi:muramoyltetrapeptide carboxypeptidase